MVQEILSESEKFQSMSAQEVLGKIISRYGDKVKQANSLGPEDLVIMHILHEINPKFKSFILDTGRLNPETYDLLGRLQEKYQLQIEIYFPDYQVLQKTVSEKGINFFYESIENRKLCCHIRKVEPLGRALQGCDAWITGLRQEQSPTRAQVKKIEVDPANSERVKVNPLADWTRDQVWDYIKSNRIPYNLLHDKNYLSIGCAPCTRAVAPGESERAGRWWWEDPANKECGLHVKS